MIKELIEKEIGEFLKNDLQIVIELTGKKISTTELQNFIVNHERLPLIKNNLLRELSSNDFLRYDIVGIKRVVRDMIKLFAETALKHWEFINEKKNSMESRNVGDI